MRTKPRAHTLLSHAEYDALPYAVRRKYFSSLERLRIEEQQHLDHFDDQRQPVSQPTSRRSSRASIVSLAKRRRSLIPGSTRRRLRKAESLHQAHDISQADAKFFLSLPHKVRQLQFSREEQILLVGKGDHQSSSLSLSSPSPSPSPNPIHLKQQVVQVVQVERVEQVGRIEQVEQAEQVVDRVEQVDRAEGAEQAGQAEQAKPRQPLNDFQFDFFDDGSTLSRGRSHTRSSSLSSISPNRVVPPKSSEQETDRIIETNLTYLDTMSSRTSHSGGVRPSSSFRRTLSLTNLPIRYSTSSAPVTTDASLFGPQLWHQRASSQSGRRSSHIPIAPVYDPEATHYQDPEARKKLRLFASAQKFDEAVEFGFPSSSYESPVAPRFRLPPITTDARNFSRDMQTFLRDDRISFLDQDDDVKSESDGESVTDVDSPLTPSSAGLSFQCHTRHASPSNTSSPDSAGLPLAHPMLGRLNREMTLRMTLTRPDLRADEEQLYGWKAQKGGKDDPFALEELHLTDDMTGAKGAFAVKPKAQGTLVSRLFKRASKRVTA